MTVSMLSLQDLLSQHACLLLIDSASACIQVGLVRAGSEPLWSESIDEAGSAVFTGAEAVLRKADLPLDAVKAFVFCEGPGSVLGIRTAAVALRTWNVVQSRPTFAYGSLDLVAKFHLRRGLNGPFSVIADARRETWHRVAVRTEGEISPLHRTQPAALVGERLLMPENFRHWAALPAPTQTVSYSVANLLAETTDIPLFRQTSEPDAFLHEEPMYQTWTPQVHRAPS